MLVRDWHQLENCPYLEKEPPGDEPSIINYLPWLSAGIWLTPNVIGEKARHAYAKGIGQVKLKPAVDTNWAPAEKSYESSKKLSKEENAIWMAPSLMRTLGVYEGCEVELNWIRQVNIKAGCLSAIRIEYCGMLDGSKSSFSQIMPLLLPLKGLSAILEIISVSLTNGRWAEFRCLMTDTEGYIGRSTSFSIKKAGSVSENSENEDLTYSQFLQSAGEAAFYFDDFMQRNLKRKPMMSSNVVLVKGPHSIGKSYLIQRVCAKYHRQTFSFSAENVQYNSQQMERRVGQHLSHIFKSLSQEDIAVIDNLEQFIFVDSKDTSQKFEVASSLLRLKRNHPRIYLATTTAVERIPSWFRAAFIDVEVELHYPKPRQRAIILSRCIHETVSNISMDVKFFKFSDQGNDNVNGETKLVQRVAQACHGFTAGGLKLMWNQILLSSRNRSGEGSLEIRAEDIEFGMKQAKENALLLRTALANGSAFTPLELQPGLKVTWDDIGGLEDTKKAIQEALDDVQSIQTLVSAQVGDTERKISLNLSAGILLYGPPGTGKTLLAKAVASMAECNFIPVSVPDLMKAEVGESEKALDTIFRLAKDCSPCVLFFDEIDALFGGSTTDTNRSGSEEVLQQLRSHFMMHLDQLHERVQDPIGHWLYHGVENKRDDVKEQGVLILATTNIPDSLDDTLIRTGRLDKLIFVPPPDEAARLSILKTYLRRMSVSAELKDEKNLKKLIEGTRQFSGADLRNLCNQAGFHALRRITGPNSLVPTEQMHVTLEDCMKALEVTPSSLSKQMFEKYAHWT